MPGNLPSDRSHLAASDSLCSRRKKLLEAEDVSCLRCDAVSLGVCFPRFPIDRSAFSLNNRQFKKTIKALIPFETSLNPRPTTQCHFTGDLNPQQHRCGHPKVTSGDSEPNASQGQNSCRRQASIDSSPAAVRQSIAEVQNITEILRPLLGL